MIDSLTLLEMSRAHSEEMARRVKVADPAQPAAEMPPGFHGRVANQLRAQPAAPVVIAHTAEHLALEAAERIERALKNFKPAAPVPGACPTCGYALCDSRECEPAAPESDTDEGPEPCALHEGQDNGCQFAAPEPSAELLLDTPEFRAACAESTLRRVTLQVVEQQQALDGTKAALSAEMKRAESAEVQLAAVRRVVDRYNNPTNEMLGSLVAMGIITKILTPAPSPGAAQVWRRPKGTCEDCDLCDVCPIHTPTATPGRSGK